jgi:hypothetical protein
MVPLAHHVLLKIVLLVLTIDHNNSTALVLQPYGIQPVLALHCCVCQQQSDCPHRTLHHHESATRGVLYSVHTQHPRKLREGVCVTMGISRAPAHLLALHHRTGFKPVECSASSTNMTQWSALQAPPT